LARNEQWETLQAAVAEAREKMGGARAALVATLEKNAELEALRVMAVAGVLGRIRDARAIEPLTSVLQDKDYRCLLFVEAGEQRGQVYELHQAVVRIGRAPENDLLLGDPSVGRLHAQFIRLEDGTYGIEDTGSANGIVLNGQRLNRGEIQPLQDGDRIQLGAAVLVFRSSGR
jgi:hypothetical protein